MQTATLKFLKDLRKNNNKPWFEDHRDGYEKAKADFLELIDDVVTDLQKSDDDIKGIEAKSCLFRINRDVRFSKDKSPYKTNFGASIKRAGKKSVFAGYYVHLEPGESFSGGGIWMPEADAMKKIRQEISYCHDEFEEILKEKKFKKVFGKLFADKEVSLTNLPKGYEKDDPAAEYLKLKSWLAIRQISDEEVTSSKYRKIILDSFTALQPMIKFINRALE